MRRGLRISLATIVFSSFPSAPAYAITCGTWEAVQSPQPSYVMSLADISMSGVDRGWAVGSYRGDLNTEALALRWNGATWRQIAVPETAEGDLPDVLYDVASRNGSSAMAVGYFDDSITAGDPHGRALALRWDGSAWDRVPAPSPADRDTSLHAIHQIPGTDDYWAVGTSYQDGFLPFAYILRWDGDRWYKVPPPEGLGNVDLSSVVAVAPDLAWAAGSAYNGPSYRQPVIMRWNGERWLKEATPFLPFDAEVSLFGIDAVSRRNAWVVGRDGNDTIVMRRSSSGWTFRPVPSPGRYALLEDVAVLGARDLYAVGHSDEDPLVLHLGVEGWVQQETPPAVGIGDHLRGVAGFSDGPIWAVGDSSDAEGIAGYVLHTCTA